MTPSFPEDRFAWLNLVGNTMPPRGPNNGDDDEDDEEDEEDEEDEDREPAVIREYLRASGDVKRKTMCSPRGPGWTLNSPGG